MVSTVRVLLLLVRVLSMFTTRHRHATFYFYNSGLTGMCSFNGVKVIQNFIAFILNLLL